MVIFLLSIGMGAWYQYVGVKLIEEQYAELAGLDDPIPFIVDLIQPGNVYGLMIFFFFMGAILLIVASSMQLLRRKKA